jgi:hypothetical protein
MDELSPGTLWPGLFKFPYIFEQKHHRFMEYKIEKFVSTERLRSQQNYNFFF